MTTLSHEHRRRLTPVELGEVAASTAIGLMWLAVLLDALFGPNIVTSNGAGTNTSSVPSAVPVAFFAFLATWALARYAFGRDR